MTEYVMHCYEDDGDETVCYLPLGHDGLHEFEERCRGGCGGHFPQRRAIVQGDCEVCDGWHPDGECFACEWATVHVDRCVTPSRVMRRRSWACDHHGDHTAWWSDVQAHGQALAVQQPPNPTEEGDRG